MLDNEEFHLRGKQNEGTERSTVYNVYNGGKLVLMLYLMNFLYPGRGKKCHKASKKKKKTF